MSKITKEKALFSRHLKDLNALLSAVEEPICPLASELPDDLARVSMSLHIQDVYYNYCYNFSKILNDFLGPMDPRNSRPNIPTKVLKLFEAGLARRVIRIFIDFLLQPVTLDQKNAVDTQYGLWTQCRVGFSCFSNIRFVASTFT